MKSEVQIKNGQINILFKQKIHWFHILFILLWCCAAIYIPFRISSQDHETWEIVVSLLFPTMGCLTFYHGVILPFFNERVLITASCLTYISPILKREKKYDTNKISDLRRSIFSAGYFTFKYDNFDVYFGEGIEDEEGETIMATILEAYPHLGRNEQLSAEEKRIEDEYWQVV